MTATDKFLPIRRPLHHARYRPRTEESAQWPEFVRRTASMLGGVTIAPHYADFDERRAVAAAVPLAVESP